MFDLGKLIKEDEGYGIRLERLYNHPVSKVWDALTDPAKMTIWFMDVEWDFKPGGKITFTFPDEERTKSYGRFVSIEHEKLIEFFWENEDGPDEFGRWELFPEDDKTRLVLTYTRVQANLATSVMTGWHIVLNDFGDFLNGNSEFLQSGDGTQFTDEQEALKAKYKELINQLENQQT